MRTQRRRGSISDFRYTPLVAALGAALAPQAAMATCAAGSICVTNPVDDNIDVPLGSLREAILNVNANCTGHDVINFDFPNGPFVSTVSETLPVISCGGLVIDGGGHQTDILVGSPTRLFGYGSANFGPGLEAFSTTSRVTIKGMEIANFQTGLMGSIDANDNIVHDNSDTGITGSTGSVISTNRVFANSTGIYVAYGGETIQLNVVYDNTYGIDVENVTSGTIANNLIGIDDGTVGEEVAGNVNTGLYLFASTVNVQSNTISGNGTGVYLDTDQGSTVQLNKIGTDATGTVPMGNFTGIYSGTPAIGTMIKNKNVISGNDVAIDLDLVDGVSIVNNFIGTDVTGKLPLLNNNGILARCSSDIEITDNVVATNFGTAIEFDEVQGGGKLNIVHNWIGVQGDGITALGNNSYGVALFNYGCGLGLSAKAARVKALAPSNATDGVLVQNNVIANSIVDGVRLDGAYNTNITGNTIVSNQGFGVSIISGQGNRILDNVIYDNTNSYYEISQAKNINLDYPSGPRPLALPDGDVAEANEGQHYPTIDAATRDASGVTTVAFTLASQPGTYRIDLYANTDADGTNGSTEPGGKRAITNKSITVPAAGTASDSFSFSDPGMVNDYFSLLATNVATQETSEFSFPVVNIVLTPGVTPASASIDFGNVSINTDSPARAVTFTSSGSADYQIFHVGDSTCYGGLICTGGPFTCTTTCEPGAYPSHATCQVTATFHPTALGTSSTSIAVCDNVTNYSPSGTPSRSISITGTGVAPPPITINPAAFDFGSTLLHSRSAPSTFTIQNPGASPVSIGTVTVTSDFDIMGNTTCGTTLGPGESCAANVAFVPTNVGKITGTLSVTASTGISALSSKGARLVKVSAAPAASSALTGTGTIEAVLNLPSAIDFGAFTSGTPALRRLVTLTNNGNALLSLSSISVTGPFLLGNGCLLNMLPGESCTLTLDFSEAALGNYTGSLIVLSNATGGSRTIPITANTVAIAAPLVRISPLQIGFGDRLLGSTSASQRVTIANVGNAPAVLSPPIVTTTDFLVTTTCGISLAPASSCFADVSFRPVGFGPRIAQLLVAGSPSPVDLSGTGCRPFSSASSRLGARFGCSP